MKRKNERRKGWHCNLQSHEGLSFTTIGSRVGKLHNKSGKISIFHSLHYRLILGCALVVPGYLEGEEVRGNMTNIFR